MTFISRGVLYVISRKQVSTPYLLTKNDDKFLPKNFQRILRSFVKLLQPQGTACSIAHLHSTYIKNEKFIFSLFQKWMEYSISYVFRADGLTTSATKAQIQRNGWNFLFRLFLLSIEWPAPGRNDMCSIRHSVFGWHTFSWTIKYPFEANASRGDAVLEY